MATIVARTYRKILAVRGIEVGVVGLNLSRPEIWPEAELATPDFILSVGIFGSLTSEKSGLLGWNTCQCAVWIAGRKRIHHRPSVQWR
jgi:hypothetical protein